MSTEGGGECHEECRDTGVRGDVFGAIQSHGCGKTVIGAYLDEGVDDDRISPGMRMGITW